MGAYYLETMVQLIKVKVSVASICKTFGELLSNPAYPHPNSDDFGRLPQFIASVPH